MLAVASLVLLLAGQRQAAKTLSALPPLIFAYGSNFRHSDSENPGAGANDKITSKYQQYKPVDLVGTAFAWHDSASYDGVNCIVDGEVKNGTARIHYVGTVTCSSNDGKRIIRGIGYGYALDVYALGSVKTIDAEATLTGSLSCESSRLEKPDATTGTLIDM